MLTTESMAALAAEAAEDEPAGVDDGGSPLLHGGQEVALQPGAVVDDLGDRLPADEGVGVVGELGGRVVPPDGHVGDGRHRHPRLGANCPLARFSSRRVMANQRSPGTSGAFERAMRQLVLQGLPTTSTRTSLAALAAMARPCGPKIPPLTVSRSPRSMPALRGMEPTSSAHEAPSKAVSRSEVATMSADQGEGTVVDLHDHALERLHRRLDLEQAQHDRLVGAEHLARGDAEQERVADLAGCPGDGDVDGRLGCHAAEANGASRPGRPATASARSVGRRR